jgi:hypothetical protein
MRWTILINKNLIYSVTARDAIAAIDMAAREFYLSNRDWAIDEVKAMKLRG